VLSQLGDDRIRHDLASMDLGRLVTVNRGVPPDLRIAVNRDTKIASSYALLDDFFQFSPRFSSSYPRRFRFINIAARD
jgi:hypothetical protein